MLSGILASVFHNPWLLLGLVVLAIPVLIHLLNRRRFDVVDWGAMQFLQVSEVTRRKLMLEELLLLLLRMGLLAVLVLALAGPFLPTAVAVTGGVALAGLVAVLVALAVAVSFRAVRRRPWLIGLLVLLGVGAAGWLAWEQSRSPSLWVATIQKRLGPSRDVVLVFDGSASMSATDETGTRSAQQAARDWALAYLDQLSPGDGVAILQAREQVLPLVGELSQDGQRVREQVRTLPAPAGSCNWPDALKAAHALLQGSQRDDREIVLLGDGQKFGWADPDTLFRWELTAGELGYNRPAPPGTIRPRIWAVPLGVEPPGKSEKENPVIPNWALAPLRGNRPVVPVDREVTFQTDILMVGQKEYVPPHKLRLEVDGKPVRDLSPPKNVKLENGKVPFSFAYKFATPGSHLVSLILEADRPPESRPEGYVLRDRVPGDNRQDYSVEVLASLPVLLVDGERSSGTTASSRGTDFLRDALSPARDRHPVVQAKVVGINDFKAELLLGEARPRVVVLANVSYLEAPQQEALTRFLADGGGLLVTLGERVEADRYNAELYHDGEGWLPARLDGIEGDESKPREGTSPDPASFTHPTLDLFRRLTVGGLGEARFPRWWKVTTPGKHSPGVAVGLLRSATAAYPFLVERTFQAGRVLLCTVPLDSSWATNVTDLPAFVPLAHELIYYLAGARSAEFNLPPGQPLRYRMEKTSAVEDFQLQPPARPAARLTREASKPGDLVAQVLTQDRGALLVFDGLREAGTWKLITPEKATIYYVVQPDPRESDLTPASEEDREKVKKLIPLTYQTDREAIGEAAGTVGSQQDLWLYLLLGMIALLCSEVWMTRRMVKSR